MVDRAALRMSELEIRQFLASQHIALVAGHDSDGVLTARRATYVLDGDTLILDLVPGEAVFDLKRQPWVCAMVDVYPSPAGIKAVIACGPASADGGVLGRLTLLRVETVSFDFSKATERRDS